ncbi:bifunctional DNA-formamidopyrimidine glycosylase/DNA-(apurinic or apyrimidinic site) lyase [Fundidesulfovibrio butyratiphilus]
MPELPEVETIARGLAPLLCGLRFTDLVALDSRVFPGRTDDFCRAVLGKLITDVRRRGKLCLVELEDASLVAFHLKMTGRLFVARPQAEPAPHVRVLLPLDDGRALHFADMRRFGVCLGFAPGAITAWDFYARLGPEPFDLTPQAFAARIGARRTAIKAALLDQHAVAGVGNIYADESLFEAGIAPWAKACDLAPHRLERLHGALTGVLRRAIEAGGSTIRDYRTAEGVEGSFQWSFHVYGRAGEPCPNCQTPLQTQKIAGRTSTFCPACQTGERKHE